MEKFIALLRGINVLGKNMIRMRDLEKSIASLKLSNIRTYIQSGNILFESSEKEVGKLEELIAGKIRADFGYEVAVVVIRLSQLEMIRNSNPFLPAKSGIENKLHVTLLHDHPVNELALTIEKEKYLPDEFILEGKAVYLFCPNGYGRTKLTNAFFESKLKTVATTRNWNTVCKLVELQAAG